jgi:ubiquinone/menaquinone biosynthesis C-methylase UbiE
VSRARPFYADYAEAYDLLVMDPVEPWAEAVHDRLLALGWPSAVVLDAGCGTGRHAAALAAKGTTSTWRTPRSGCLRRPRRATRPRWPCTLTCAR